MAKPVGSVGEEGRFFASAGVQLAPWLLAHPFGVGAALLGVLLAGYAVGSVAAGDPLRLDTDFRVSSVLALLTAYSATVGLIEFRMVPRDMQRLRGLLECDDETFAVAVRASVPGRGLSVLAVCLGGLFGAAISAASGALSGAPGPLWISTFHEAWNDGSNVALFALLGLLTLWGTRSAQLYSTLSSRYARIALLDPRPFDLFAERGLRQACFWFGGSAIALLLVVEAEARAVVLLAIAVTFAVSVASLVLPSLGIHRRMRHAKAAELARVRGEIETRLAALRAGESVQGHALPALLAWELRVAQVPEWPLGGGVLVRFGLLVLIPLGSWLGGALVERVVDAALG